MYNWSTDTLNVYPRALELGHQRPCRVELDHVQVKEVGLWKEKNGAVVQREAKRRKALRLLTDQQSRTGSSTCSSGSSC